MITLDHDPLKVLKNPLGQPLIISQKWSNTAVALDSASSPLALGCGFHWNLSWPWPSQPQFLRNGRQKSLCVQHLPLVNEIMACFHVSKNHQIFWINHDRSQLPGHCAPRASLKLLATRHLRFGLSRLGGRPWCTTATPQATPQTLVDQETKPKPWMDGLGCSIHGFSTKGGYSSPEHVITVTVKWKVHLQSCARNETNRPFVLDLFLHVAKLGIIDTWFFPCYSETARDTHHWCSPANMSPSMGTWFGIKHVPII